MSLARVVIPTVLFLGLASSPPIRRSADSPPAEANDNRTPAGHLAGDSLVVALEIRTAEWYPEKPDGPHVLVAAFGEEGKATTVPGPLIRIPTGTVVVATLRNTLSDSAVTIRGFRSRPYTTDDGITLNPGEQTTVRFPAGAPGTYFYDADVGVQPDSLEREQLAGAFIVDPASGSPPDRVFVINIWAGWRDSATWGNALAINGRSWPYTERVGATVGDSIRWRVINPSVRPHPMHLHGVYFRQDSRGARGWDSAWTGDDRQLIVTSAMRALSTLTMAWRPDRPGNWLFHCHLMFHAGNDARLVPDIHEAHSGDPDRHMAGLVLGIQAAPRPGDTVEEPRPNPRRLSIYAQEGARRDRADRALGFVLQQGGTPPAVDSVEHPGSLLVLTRGQPTDITIHNRMKEPTAIHWHGIELESWSDGVPGWSGSGTRLAPMVAPGDSFVARLTLPRAGTFIYHTHLNDIEQVTSGLYGPLVVLEPGQQFDPSTDHIFLASWDGPGEPPHVLINGDSLPRNETLEAGVAHRFRFINIGPAGGVRFSIVRGQDSVPQSWSLLAKDGANVPESRRASRRAYQPVNIGETWDFLFQPPAPGEYRLYYQFSGLQLGARTLLRQFTVQ
ncbi:MAG TPA: multicopper oxidase domain-containing protein [Gemmatimonadales bacterium]|nr:multicopper oxidase domain-containing protein [Gemmatimonadales bacterium]